MRNLNELTKPQQVESNWNEQKSIWIADLSQLPRLPTAVTQHNLFYYSILTYNELFALSRLHISRWCFHYAIHTSPTELENLRHCCAVNVNVRCFFFCDLDFNASSKVHRGWVRKYPHILIFSLKFAFHTLNTQRVPRLSSPLPHYRVDFCWFFSSTSSSPLFSLVHWFSLNKNPGFKHPIWSGILELQICQLQACYVRSSILKTVDLIPLIVFHSVRIREHYAKLSF